jgi:hypothetical protein
MRRRLQLTAVLVVGCASAQQPEVRAPRVCETACAVPLARDAGAPVVCPPAPEDERLEQALSADAGEVWLDACRVVLRLASSSGSRCSLLVTSSKARYLEERGADFVRECVAAPDGVFETEYVERFGDAGWQLRSSTFAGRDGGVAVRVTSSPLRWGQRREVRASWRDGGWLVDSDTTESKPRVVPISR